jgi:predicted ATPase
MELGMTCRLLAALALWLLGYPDQALQRSQEGMTLAHESSHPFSLGSALGFTAELHQFRREWRLAREQAEAAIALSAAQGFPYFLATGQIFRGWALAEQGQVEEGISQLRQGLDTQQAVGAGIFHTYFLVLLAEAYGKAGQAEEGLNALAEALTVVDKSGERFYEAEQYRLRGELLLQSNGQGAQSCGEEAEAFFHKAIDIARRQQAKSLELRAGMSLARLWQQQGKQIEAHQLLSEVYGWFTEGFDTKDLQEAKALLEELH